MFGVLALARLRPLWMTQTREHALLAGPPTTTCSRSDVIQSSGKPEALHDIAAPLPQFGVLALATALDDAGSGTRPAGRPYDYVFPLRRDPKLRQAEALHNIAAPLPKFGVLALARLRPLWMTQAREHALLAGPPTTTCSRSDAIQSSGKPEALHDIAAPLPKFGVLALARLRPLWMTQAWEHALLAAPTTTCSRSDAIQSSAKSEALQT